GPLLDFSRLDASGPSLIRSRGAAPLLDSRRTSMIRVRVRVLIAALLLGAWCCSAQAAITRVPVPSKAAPRDVKRSEKYRRDLPDPPGPGTVPGDYVMLRIADRSIPASEFVNSYFSAWAADRPKEDSLGRVQFMRNMVHKELLAHEAKRLNVPLTFEDRLELREHSARVYSNLLYQRVVVDPIRVDENEVR